MANLLIDESPLMVQPSLVIVMGGSVQDAVMLQQLHWLVRQDGKDVVEHGGERWVRASYAVWARKWFRWLAADTVRKRFARLVAAEWVIHAQPELDSGVATSYLRPNYAKLVELELTPMRHDRAASPIRHEHTENPSGTNSRTLPIGKKRGEEGETEGATNSPADGAEQPEAEVPLHHQLFEALAKITELPITGEDKSNRARLGKVAAWLVKKQGITVKAVEGFGPWYNRKIQSRAPYPEAVTTHWRRYAEDARRANRKPAASRAQAESPRQPAQDAQGAAQTGAAGATPPIWDAVRAYAEKHGAV